MSELLLLRDAQQELARFVDDGSCTLTTINNRITEACQRLTVKADWIFSTATVRIRTDNQCFPLPREAAAIRWCNICGAPAYARNQAFEFLASGPGEVKHRLSTSGIKDLIDAGYHCLMYDIPPLERFETTTMTSCVDRTLGQGLQIAAFSTEVEGNANVVTMFGHDRLLNEIGEGVPGLFTPGESFAINRWAGGVEGSIVGPLTDLILSDKRYRSISRWTKPVTKGHITLYAVDTSTRYMWLLAKAHPRDEVPMWRRYKISGQACVNDCANILALVKMKALPLSDSNDLLPIQSLPAIKNMLLAIREENAGRIPNAIAHEQTAVRILTEQLQDSQLSAGTPVVIDQESQFALSNINSGLIL